MLKSKIGTIILILTATMVVLAGCSSKQQTAQTSSGTKTTEQAQQTSASDKLIDGVYKVEYENFDSHDYKPQLELTISGGKITEVKYDEIGKDGKFKSQDEQYKKKMEEQSKTYPAKAYSELKQQLLTKQSSNLDAVTGATASSDTFKVLVKYALDNMSKKGVTTPAKIPAPK